MLQQLSETVVNSIQELVSKGIQLIPAILMALVILMLTRYGSHFLQPLSEKVAKKTIKSKSLQLLFSKSVHVFTWVVGIILACVIAFPGLNLGDIVATLGLGSVAIGFAFQDIFKNFLSGILLLIQEPFKIGDQIIVNSYEGTVERIDIRTTKIRTYQGEQILIPNSTIFTSEVQVRTAFSARRTDLAVGLDYNTSLEKGIEILESAIKNVEGVLGHPVPEIDLVGYGDSSIDFVVRYWTKPQQAIVRRTQTKAMLTVKEFLDREGMIIPYPIRTLYYFNQDKYNDYMPQKDNHDNHKVLQ